jgi:hypothetical protein
VKPQSPQVLAVWAALAAACASPAQTQFPFAPPVVMNLGFPAFPNSIDAGDLDGDGFADIVVSGRNADGAFVLFFGSAAGFGPPVPQALGGQSNWATFTHLNGDRHLDLVVSNRQGLGRVSVFLGDGTRTLPAPSEYAAGRDPELVRAADLDGDGDLDLAVFNWGSHDVSILLNDGTGTFTAAPRVPVDLTAVSPRSPAWGEVVDLDGDGDLDIAAASVSSIGQVHILLNHGNGTFRTAIQQFVPGVGAGEAMGTLAAADLDGDGDADLVTKAGGLSFLDRLIVLANDSEGRFQAAGEIQLSAGLGGSPWDVVATDLDGDGVTDLAWVTHAFSTQSLVMLRHLGNGILSFDLPEQAIQIGGFPRSLRPIDLEGDGDLDIVVADIGSHRVAVFESGKVQATERPRQDAGQPGGAEFTSAPEAQSPRQDAERLTRTTNGATKGDIIEVNAVLASAGSGVCGEPGSGSCIEPHDTPGCANAECCSLVCKQLPQCCFAAWDEGCAEAAEDGCEQPACPSAGSCFQAHGNSGCDDQACCELLCSIDFFCCGGPWDALCAEEAAQICTAQACVLPDCPPGATAEDEGTECGVRLNDGCNLAAPAFTPIACGETICGSAWNSVSRDTDWYELALTEPTAIAWTVTAEFPVEVHVVTGSCADRWTVEATAWGGPCASATAHLTAGPGTVYLFVAPGTEADALPRGIPCLIDGKPASDPVYGGRYVAMLACSAPCAADLDGNGTVNVRDFFALLLAWGRPASGPPDLDGDGTVGASDFQLLLAAWGDCRGLSPVGTVPVGDCPPPLLKRRRGQSPSEDRWGQSPTSRRAR